ASAALGRDRRQPWLGVLPARRLCAGARDAGARRRTRTGASDSERSSRRRVLAHGPAHRSALPVGARALARARRCGRYSRQARTRPAARTRVAFGEAMSARVFAPAKVNLTLQVGRPRADGMHPLQSVVMFADVGDWIEAEPREESALRI